MKSATASSTSSPLIWSCSPSMSSRVGDFTLLLSLARPAEIAGCAPHPGWRNGSATSLLCNLEAPNNGPASDRLSGFAQDSCSKAQAEQPVHRRSEVAKSRMSRHDSSGLSLHVRSLT